MGIYEYQCPQGHVTELMVRLEARPHTTTCTLPDCGQTAAFVVSAPYTTFHANDRKAIKRKGH